MARGLNKVTLIGNVGNDPEVRSTTGGQRVASLSLATSREWKDRDGTKQEKTDWHRLVVWGKLADVVEKYVTKGDKLYVEGRVEYRQWQDKDGQTRYTTEINVGELLMLGGGKGGGRGDGDAPANGNGRAGMERMKERSPAMARAEKKAEEDDFEDFPGALNDDDDDLPF